MNQDEILEQLRIILRDTYEAGVNSVNVSDGDWTDYDFQVKIDQILSLLENYEP